MAKPAKGPKPSKSDLKRLYIKESRSVRNIAELLECSKDMVYRALREYGIQRRTHTEKRSQLLDYDLRTLKRECVGSAKFGQIMDFPKLQIICDNLKLGEMHGYTTWDNELGKYAFFWFDNLLTKPTVYYEDWVDSQTLVFKGEVHSRGKITYSRIKWRFVSENELDMVREVSTDGKNFRVNVETNYKKGREQ